MNTSKRNFRAGVSSAARVFGILLVIARSVVYSFTSDICYLVLSQSISGNLRDLITLSLMANCRIIVHLHGGGIKNTVYDKNRFIARINALVLKRVSKIIVLSDSLKQQFHSVVSDKDKIVTLPNFADETFFVSDSALEKKFDAPQRDLVFLSNMIPSKGYMELVSAYSELPESEKKNSSLAFAGAFANPALQREFLSVIADEPSIDYVGVLSGEARGRLVRGCVGLILPTYYPYEGQPLAILEAYAAGCVVVTTRQGGIGDVFTAGINGFLARRRSTSSLKDCLSELLKSDGVKLHSMAHTNRSLAQSQFHPGVFDDRILELFGLASGRA